MNRKTELSIILGISLTALIVSTAVYIYGYLHTPSGLQYLGIRMNNFPDTNSYLNWIIQGSQNHFLFAQLYSLEGGAHSFFHPLFLILGFCMKFFGGIPILWYHIGRVLCTALLLFSGYSAIKILVENAKWRIIAFIIFTFSSGLGWFFDFSADNTQIEATNFINMHESLLNPFSLSLIIWTIIFFFYKEISFTKKVIICIALLNLLILVHSYDFIIISTILFCGSIFNFFNNKDTNYLRALLYIIIGCFPAIFVQLYALNSNEALAVWAVLQSRVPAVPSLFYYLSGVGFQIIFLIIGLVSLLSKERQKWLPWIVWLILLPIFLWNPLLVKFQRKLMIGAFIPISLFTFLGIRWCYLKGSDILANKLSANFALGSVIVILALSNVMLIANDIKDINNLYPYISKDLASGIEFIKTVPNGNILTSTFSGNLIPGFTGKMVYIGHYDQTVNFSEKAVLSQQVLSSIAGDRDPLKFFVKWENINYIFVDEEVRSWGGLDTTNRPYLQLVFENKDVQIYQIQKELLN